MIHVNAILRHLSVKDNSLTQIASGLNKDLVANFKKGVYLTLNLIQINNDSQGNSIELVRAGHIPFLLFKYETKELIEINPKGSGIGLFSEELFEKNLQSSNIEMKANDILILYTDGLTETMNSNKSEYGIERLRKIVLQYNAYDPTGLKNEILKDIADFRKDESIHDDISLIILKKK